MSNTRYSSGKIKEWKNDGKASLESVLAEVVTEVRGYFVAANKRRAQEVIERKRQAIEWEMRQREFEKEEAIRRENEQLQKHAEALNATAHTRSEDLFKAAEWWRLHRVATEFIRECEQRWRSMSAGELTAEQQAWLTWARENANALSPLETGYPDPFKDGPFDPAVPFGGPYPSKKEFSSSADDAENSTANSTKQLSWHPSARAKATIPFWLKYPKK